MHIFHVCVQAIHWLRLAENTGIKNAPLVKFARTQIHSPYSYSRLHTHILFCTTEFQSIRGCAITKLWSVSLTNQLAFLTHIIRVTLSSQTEAHGLLS